MTIEGQAGGTGGVESTQTNTTPGMTEIEIDGEKINVPETVAGKIKSSTMAHADYTRKTQTLAEERRALEEESQVAREFNKILEENPDMIDVVEALTSGDRQKAKALLDAEGSGDTESQLNKRIDQLERKLQIRDVNDTKQKTTQAYIADLKTQYPDFASHEKEIAKVMADSQKNPILPVYLAATLPKKIEEARQAGIKEGRESALKSFDDRFAESPPIGGAGGGAAQGKDTRSAAMRAYQRLQQ